MDKDTFLKTLSVERQKWEMLLDRFDDEQFLQPGAAGEWSVKDVIAHVSWHEREMLGVVMNRALVGSLDLWNLPLAQRNAAIYELNRERTLEDVLEQAWQVYETLVNALEALPPEYFENSALFSEMPPEWEPWKLLAENTYEHYQDHARDLEALLAQLGEE